MTRTDMLRTAAAGIGGLIFGFGLAISGMTHPEKIKDFLDVTLIPSGGWDPSLAFVMGGALLVTMIFYRLSRPPRQPLFSPSFDLNQRTEIDAQLVGGAAIFGVGWGLVGLCPGPAIADLSLIPGEVIGFVAAMAIGSWAVGLFRDARPFDRGHQAPAE